MKGDVEQRDAADEAGASGGASLLISVFAGHRGVGPVRYDPMIGPTPDAWLELDEGEQAELVLRYHKRHGARAGNMRLHAIIHATVETQLAERHVAATAALERLLGDGLDRHEAIHAIGSVVAEQIHGAMQGTAFDAGVYERRLSRLDAASWRRMAEEE